VDRHPPVYAAVATEPVALWATLSRMPPAVCNLPGCPHLTDYPAERHGYCEAHADIAQLEVLDRIVEKLDHLLDQGDRAEQRDR
jgi:hypothetical protein